MKIAYLENLQELANDIAAKCKSLFVRKEDGKGLSSNDYTNEEKSKLAGISSGAKPNVQSDWNTNDTSSDAFIKNKPSVYTKNEVDNKFSALENDIDWKEAVDTYNDIAKTYPNPENGWTVSTKDTNYIYRFNGKEWIAISANAIPKATDKVDGLLSKEDHANYEDANEKKHEHENKTVLDKITSALIDKWNSAITTLGGVITGTLHTRDIYVGGFEDNGSGTMVPVPKNESSLRVNGTFESYGNADFHDHTVNAGDVKSSGKVESKSIKTSSDAVVGGGLSVDGETTFNNRVKMKNTLDMGGKDITNVQSATVNGTLRAKGDTVSHSVKPEENDTYNLGNKDKRYNNAYVKKVIADSIELKNGISQTINDTVNIDTLSTPGLYSIKNMKSYDPLPYDVLQAAMLVLNTGSSGDTVQIIFPDEQTVFYFRNGFVNSDYEDDRWWNEWEKLASIYDVQKLGKQKKLLSREKPQNVVNIRCSGYDFVNYPMTIEIVPFDGQYSGEYAQYVVHFIDKNATPSITPIIPLSSTFGTVRMGSNLEGVVIKRKDYSFNIYLSYGLYVSAEKVEE